MAEKSMYDKFAELIEMEGGVYNAFRSPPSSHSNDFDEERETLFTSKEMVQMELQSNPAKGPVIPGATPVGIEERLQFKTYSKRRQHKYTKTEMAKIEAGCEYVFVHDYSARDSYHISDEERMENDSLREMRKQLGTLHKMYNKVDQWVEAMRIVVKAWEELERRDNFLHTKEEFFQLVASDRIYHPSIIMPRLKGMSKYNLDVLIQYISNPELDPKDLLTNAQKQRQKAVDLWYEDLDDEESDETEEEKMERLLSPEDAEYILSCEEHPEDLAIIGIPQKDIVGYDQRGIMRRIQSKKKKGKRNRRKEAFRKDLHGILRQIENNPANRPVPQWGDYSSLITTGMFEHETPKTSEFWKGKRFKGSWADQDAVLQYNLYLRECLMSETVPEQRYTTYGDREINEFFSIMESTGMNVLELRRRMNMSQDDLIQQSAQQTKKETKKLEAAILQRITKLNRDPKFKKTVAKAEKSINRSMEEST